MALLNVLTLIFLVLKLTGYIDWSWWLILLPTIIQVVLWTLGTILVIITAEKNSRF